MSDLVLKVYREFIHTNKLSCRKTDEIETGIAILLDQLEQKDKEIGKQSMQLSDMAGHITGMTCMLCNNIERAVCYDKRTEVEKENKELKTRNDRLKQKDKELLKTTLQHQEAMQLHLYLDQLNVAKESENIGDIELSLIGRVNTYTEQLTKRITELEKIEAAAKGEDDE